MSYLTNAKEILDLFRAAGKPVPHEDSNMGRAVTLLQTICDAHSHTVPDAEDEQEAAKEALEKHGVQFFPGNAACDPYATCSERGGYEFRYDGETILEVVAKAALALDIELDIASDIFEALENLEKQIEGNEYDFSFEFDGAEYRLIGSDEETIWPIYRDEIQRMIEDCYSDVLKLEKIPSFIAVSVDWEQTARNAYVDGYGHQFSGYDGSEYDAAGYYIFRTN